MKTVLSEENACSRPWIVTSLFAKIQMTVVLVPEDDACRSVQTSPGQLLPARTPAPSTRNAATAAPRVSEQNVAYPNKCDLAYQNTKLKNNLKGQLVFKITQDLISRPGKPDPAQSHTMLQCAANRGFLPLSDTVGTVLIRRFRCLLPALPAACVCIRSNRGSLPKTVRPFFLRGFSFFSCAFAPRVGVHRGDGVKSE